MDSNTAFDVFTQIAQARGHSKLRFLTPDLKDYLIAAYDPYTRYYMKKIEFSNPASYGTQSFTLETWGILDELSNRTLTGNAAQRVVDAHIKQLAPKSGKLFIRILNKDLRMGLGVKSINKAIPKLIPTHNVMLAKLFEINRVKFPCFGSPKIDGVRALFKRGEFYSRNGHIYQGLDTLKAHVRDLFGKAFEDIPVLDGELTVTGENFQKGSGLIRNKDEVMCAHFSIFELPELKSPFTSRLIQMADLHGITPAVTPVEHTKMLNMDDIMTFYWACRSIGFEGAVIKPFDYDYVGSRSYRWMKMKNELSADVKVVAVEEGTGKYIGQMGKIVVDFNGVKVKVGTGFSDAERELYYTQPNLVISKMTEILYMEKTPDGSMRHPRFLRLRPDKD